MGKRMMELTEAFGFRFRTMSLLCSFLVVFVHAGSDGEWTTSGRWLFWMLGWGISSVAVPYFFFASGFFMAGHLDDPLWYRKALSARVRTLLVPYIFWCVAYWLLLVGGGGEECLQVHLG